MAGAVCSSCSLFLLHALSKSVNVINDAVNLAFIMLLPCYSFSAFLAQRKPKLSFLVFGAKKARLKAGADMPH
jgi:hypothetical protein